jgi:hypothetical protein
MFRLEPAFWRGAPARSETSAYLRYPDSVVPTVCTQCCSRHVMSSLPTDPQGLHATFIPDEGIPAIHPLVADVVADLKVKRDVCCQLLQTLNNVSNSARDSANPETCLQALTQLDLVRVACALLLQVLGSPSNDPHGENQVLAISGIYPHVMQPVLSLRSIY